MSYFRDFLKEESVKENGVSIVKTESKITPETKKIPEIQKKDKKSKPQRFTICPTCNKRKKITGEKTMNRNEIIQWFQNFLSENKENLPLDWLRGKKLDFESVNEMRK